MSKTITTFLKVPAQFAVSITLKKDASYTTPKKDLKRAEKASSKKGWKEVKKQKQKIINSSVFKCYSSSARKMIF